MLDMDIGAEGLKEIRAALKNSSPLLGKRMLGAIMEIGNYTKDAARGSLHPGGPGYATGDLQRNIYFHVRSEWHGEVTSEAPHSAFVEYPTRPHWPPISALVEWVRIKFGLHGREAESAGFLVARAISRKGTKGIFFMERAFRYGLTKVPAALNRAMNWFLQDLTRR